MSSSKQMVLALNEWNPQSTKFMAPKTGGKGGKSIMMINTDTSRSIYLKTPLMMTWGISDFVDEKGDADGKFSMSLQFPGDDYKNKFTDEYLEKIKEFENVIMDAAVTNSLSWFGKQSIRAVIEDKFCPILKYPNNKETMQKDYTRPPCARLKVPNYEGKWSVEIFDTKQNKIFPPVDESLDINPVNLVQKMAQVACVIQASSIWIAGNGFGVTWKLIQCVVKPREVITAFGQCHIQLSSDDVEKMDGKPAEAESMDEPEPVPVPVLPKKKTVVVKPSVAQISAQVQVADSDDEKEDVSPPLAPEPEPVIESVEVETESAPVAEQEPVVEVAPVKKTMKKIIKKA